MPPFYLLAVVYFIAVAFLSKSPDPNLQNPFLSFYYIQIHFILGNLIIFGLLFVVLTLIFVRFSGRKKNKLLRNYLLFLTRTLVVFVAVSFVSFVFLFVVAIVEMNLLSTLTYIDQGLLGVETNPQIIAQKLRLSGAPPSVIAGRGGGSVLAKSIATADSGKESFYGNNIISHTPTFFIIPARKLKSGVLLIGNSLIVNKIDSPDFQKVSPVVSALMIKRYFPGKAIKSFPEVSIMTEDEYRVYRKADFADKLKKYDEVIKKIHEDISSLASDIQDLNGKLTQNENQLKEITNRKDKDYSKCINTGYYANGIFYKSNSVIYCQAKVAGLQQQLQEINSNTNELKGSLAQTTTKLDLYQSYDRFYASQKVLTQEESDFISSEFGTFNPPDQIKISLSLSNSPESLADYMELLVHEYLHYASYDQNGKKLGSTFFEEGLTEYFARKIIRDNLGVETNLGYPVDVKIITQMAKRIDESDLADIYFANDQAGLQKLTDRVYGEGFYANNQVLLETLQYSSNEQEILKIGNDVMSEIGGSPIKDSDISTSYSTFR